MALGLPRFTCSVWSAVSGVAPGFFSVTAHRQKIRDIGRQRQYCIAQIDSSDLTAHPPTPWRKILTSVPVWALTIASFSMEFTFFSMVICLPLFMYDVLSLNMTDNGLLSAVPFAASLIMLPLSGILVDFQRAPGRLSTTTARKVNIV